LIDTAEVEEVGILLEFIEGITIPAVLIIAMEMAILPGSILSVNRLRVSIKSWLSIVGYFMNSNFGKFN